MDLDTPDSDDHDEAARREGWVRHDQDRSFRVVHREYLIQELDGFDYDHQELARAVHRRRLVGFMEHLAMLDAVDDPATTTTWLECGVAITAKGAARARWP